MLKLDKPVWKNESSRQTLEEIHLIEAQNTDFQPIYYALGHSRGLLYVEKLQILQNRRQHFHLGERGQYAEIQQRSLVSYFLTID